MIPLQDILTKYNLTPKGVIQVGSHFAEEHDDFVKCGIEQFVYIEPCKDAATELAKRLNLEGGGFHPASGFMWVGLNEIKLFILACGSEEGLMPMYVSHQNQGQSNSLLKPEGHLSQHPEIVFDDAEVVKVVTLDSLPIEKEKYDMLVMDCQGYEGEVLKGATETLKQVSIIYTEINRGQTYSGNMEIEEMDAFLAEYGFKRVETHWPSPSWTWGDACYISEKYL